VFIVKPPIRKISKSSAMKNIPGKTLELWEKIGDGEKGDSQKRD